MSIKISLGTHGHTSFPRWVPSYTLEETIDRIADIGYDGIEIMASSPHLWPDYMGEEDIKKIMKKVEDRGLEVAALCAALGGGPGLNPASPIEKERIASVKYYTDLIRIATGLNCKTVVVLPGWVVWPTPYEQAWDWLVKNLKKCATVAEDADVVLAVEPVSPNWANLVVTMFDGLRLLESVGSKNVQLNLDSCQVYESLQNLTDYIEKWGKEHIAHVHISESERLPLGRGDINLKAFLNALKAIKYDKWLSVELWGPDPDSAAFESLEYLKQIMRTLNI